MSLRCTFQPNGNPHPGKFHIQYIVKNVVWTLYLPLFLKRKHLAKAISFRHNASPSKLYSHKMNSSLWTVIRTSTPLSLNGQYTSKEPTRITFQTKLPTKNCPMYKQHNSWTMSNTFIYNGKIKNKMTLHPQHVNFWKLTWTNVGTHSLHFISQ